MSTAKKLYGFEPDYAISPGETLKEVMESLNMSQKELVIRTGLTVQSLNRIFKGDQPISYETANKLELVDVWTLYDNSREVPVMLEKGDLE
jgi:transcriptional regulator with XRE-family HTH domain